MKQEQLWKADPLGYEKNVIRGEKYRFTILTPCLVRMEYSEDGVFEDRPTQIVWNRNLGPVSFRMVKKGEGFEIFTDRMHLSYDGKEFTSNGLFAVGMGGVHPHGSVYRYGVNELNLKGTARTLDEADGACELQDGLMSVYGSAVLDDSGSLVLTEDGWIAPREHSVRDIYLFIYGNDYEMALRDFYRISGKTPMLPRYALGNWWSRYYEYSEESYKELVERFESENLPFSVAVIDMDWHLVKEVDPKYGNGWTGFTWNRSLFPDPQAFLRWLHEHGMKTTLNLHPADGIRAYEEAYPAIAGAMGTDTANEEPVEFDIADRKFLEKYFECVLHPREDEGVDFWWIDWQQGNNTRVPGLDPLWMLNHYHYLDSMRKGRRGMTFSRYAGPGSHRYPVGFSGDTFITWASLDFQPYFTSTASNIGYGWWSHDIGGHMGGTKDNELALRWLQLGVFSPVNRLHSTKNEFNGKEPWRYPMEVHSIMNDFLRLRHRLIPYLYTMNHRAWKDDMPVIVPMYYRYPAERSAYKAANQYMFGTELMVMPITSPQIEGIDRGRVRAWLPEGYFYDVFTGMRYKGGKTLDMYRSLNSIPVLAKAGAVIPMTEEIGNADANPENISIRVYAGEDGAFELYEDDNTTMGYLEGRSAVTAMKLDWKNRTFVIGPLAGEAGLVPENRSYSVRLYGVNSCKPSVSVDGSLVSSGCSYDEEAACQTVIIPHVSSEKQITVSFENCELKKNDVEKRIFDFLNQAEIKFDAKTSLYRIASKCTSTGAGIAEMETVTENRDLIGCLAEMLTAEE